MAFELTMIVGGVPKQFLAVDWSQAMRVLVQNNLTPTQARGVLSAAFKDSEGPVDFMIERDAYSVTCTTKD